MNPYQRIPGVQEGHVDTATKFRQMVKGVDLKGLRVVDVGCNLGEMSRMAAARGAKVHGVDRRPEFIEQARRLTPGKPPSFKLADAYELAGVYDLAIVSAAFHYFRDPLRFLEHLARITKRVRVDVWVAPGADRCMVLSSRNLLIPTESLFEWMAARSFEAVECLGPVESPDSSRRLLYDLNGSKAPAPRAVIIRGAGDSGKSTLSRSYKAQGFKVLELDRVFVSWRMRMTRWGWSVPNWTKTLRGEKWGDYLTHARWFIGRWLAARRSLDVCLEGYEALTPEYRQAIVEELTRLGWGDIEHVETTVDPSKRTARKDPLEGRLSS